MVHGAHHAWARLDWLYEYAIVLFKYENQFENIKSECKKLGLENLFNYSTLLCNIIFQTNYPVHTYTHQEEFFLKFCINAIQEGKTPEVSKPVQRLKYKFYLMKLKKGFRYKTHVWLAMRTNMPDWDTMKLPANLFFLYYILRPVIVILNRFKKNNPN